MLGVVSTAGSQHTADTLLVVPALCLWFCRCYGVLAGHREQPQVADSTLLEAATTSHTPPAQQQPNRRSRGVMHATRVLGVCGANLVLFLLLPGSRRHILPCQGGVMTGCHLTVSLLGPLSHDMPRRRVYAAAFV